MKILVVSINDLSSIRGPRFALEGLVENLCALGCEVLEERFCPEKVLIQDFVRLIVESVRVQSVDIVFCDTPLPLMANKIQERALLASLSKTFLATKVWEEAIDCPVLFVVDPVETGTKALALGPDFFGLRAGEIEEWQRQEREGCAAAINRDSKNFKWQWRNFPATPDKLAINETLRSWVWAVKNGQTLNVYDRRDGLSAVCDENSQVSPVPIGFIEKSIGNGSLEKILEILK